MYQIKTEKHIYNLKAKARYYREFKMALGVSNLKAAFFKAFDDVDIDFLANWIKWFNEDRDMKIDTAYDVIDEYLEDDETHTLYDLYADAAEFMNGMGFFGKRLEVGAKERTIAFFEDKTNRVNMDEKMADALDTGLTNIVNKLVEERLMEEKEKADKA